MKILILADPSNPHTVKWVNSLSTAGIEIFLFGLSKYDANDYSSKVKIETLKTPSSIKSKLSGNIFKIIYFTVIPKLKKIIKNYKPDILHAHYAGSYGLMRSLLNFHPFILSVWGVDINIYPHISFLHKYFIKYTLRKSDVLLATSEALKEETLRYVQKDIKVTPFGIDLNKFKPENVQSGFSEDDIVIGTVKRLEHKYGIDQLIKAFSIVKKNHPELPLKLLLVGEGSIRNQLVDLAAELGLNETIIFAGNVSISEVANFHNMIDISVYLSKTESFGVSVLESSASEKPVIVTDVGGLPAVVDDGITGIIVPPDNPIKAAEAIERLVLNSDLRKQMGKAGREKVKSEYNWEDNVQQMINIYERVANSK